MSGSDRDLEPRIDELDRSGERGRDRRDRRVPVEAHLEVREQDASRPCPRREVTYGRPIEVPRAGRYRPWPERDFNEQRVAGSNEGVEVRRPAAVAGIDEPRAA